MKTMMIKWQMTINDKWQLTNMMMIKREMTINDKWQLTKMMMITQYDS